MEQSFFTIYFMAITAIAGLAVLWRNWLVDHPSWKKVIEQKLAYLAKALTCGSCFTFWSALLFVAIFNPLGQHFVGLGGLIAQWLSISWGAVFLRFLYVAVQEYVHGQVHKGGHSH